MLLGIIRILLDKGYHALKFTSFAWTGSLLSPLVDDNMLAAAATKGSTTVTKQNRNVSKNRFSEYILKAIESVNVYIRVLNSIFRATLKRHHELT